MTERNRTDVTAGARVGPLGAVRAIAVVFGGSLALVGAATACLAAATRALARGRVPSPRALTGLAGVAVYAARVLPWMRSWGATPAERSMALPGDELVSRPAFQTTRAVTVDAPPRDVWPWLAQIGQERGGFYSYSWLENLAGCRLRNADRVHPEWQHREVGERIMLHPATGVPIARWEPGHALVLEGWGAFVLLPADGGRRTRLLSRSRVGRGPGAAFYALLVEIPHFIMERRMLIGIRDRAESPSR